MKVWLPDNPARAGLGELPEAVEVNLIPREGALPQEIETVEFLVPPYGSRRVIEALPRLSALRVVQVNSAGVDWIAPSVPAGVALCSARGTRDAPVAEWVVGAILDSYKGFARFRRQQERAQWKPLMPRELAGSKALIVGYGSIGRAVEDRLRPFGVEVTGVASRRRGDTHGVDAIDKLLPDADIVVVLLPATPETAGLLDKHRLAKLKTGALLVNAGRGTVVDMNALCDELESGRLEAALDVTDPEPLPPESPLWRLPNVLLTPHIAGDSPVADQRVYELIGDQIRRHLEGHPLLNVVR
ncbi:MAG TPA: 2-hydroxyacid dehydrogenase [Solirubrobacterales bacterium]|nr:2-hydroxyacid dehydrogenase [Solirubrobacterales bacterium]